MTKDQFNVDVQIRINKVRPDGGYTGEMMSVSQEFKLHADNFLELAAVLGRFQELGDKIKSEKSG